MKVILAIPLLLVPFFWPVLTGLMAKNFGRKFWFWFFMGIPLPFLSMLILLCLQDRSKKKITELKAVENENVFDHLFINKNSKQIKDPETYLSARA